MSYEKLFKIITDILEIALKKASGFWGFLLGFIYNIFQKKVIKVGENIDNSIEAKKEAEEKVEEYNHVVKNPESTNDEIIKTEDDFFNRP